MVEIAVPLSYKFVTEITMPAYITDNEQLATRLQALADAQPIATTRSGMIEQVCHEACKAFEASGDPESWKPATVPNGAQRKNDGSDSIRSNPKSSQGSHRANGNAKRQKEHRAQLDVKG